MALDSWDKVKVDLCSIAVSISRRQYSKCGQNFVLLHSSQSCKTRVLTASVSADRHERNSVKSVFLSTSRESDDLIDFAMSDNVQGLSLSGRDRLLVFRLGVAFAH